MVRPAFRVGAVAGLMDAPGKPALGLDLQPQVVARLGEGRLEELGADVVALPEGADPREPVERTGTVAPGRGGGDDLFQQRACTLRLARLEVILGGLDPPSARVAGEVGRRQAASLLPQRRRSIWGSAGAGSAGGLVQFGCELGIRPGSRENEMPGALLRIVEHRRKASVQLATLRARYTGVQNGCEERMSEPHPLAVRLEHACIDPLIESGVGAGCPRSGTHEVDRSPPQ